MVVVFVLDTHLVLGSPRSSLPFETGQATVLVLLSVGLADGHRAILAELLL